MDIAADGADRIELDPAELDMAERELARRYDELAGYLATARELGVELQDGKSPVRRPMGRAFGLRGGAGVGGVQTALQGYLNELAVLREAIQEVRAVHQTNDQQNAAAMRARQGE